MRFCSRAFPQLPRKIRAKPAKSAGPPRNHRLARKIRAKTKNCPGPVRDRRSLQPSAATTATRAASAISGQNLVEGFAGAGVGVDRAGQVGGGQALLDGQRHQVDQLLGVDH